MNGQKLKVGFKKLNKDAIMPKFAHHGDAGMDICSIEDAELMIGRPTMVKTGLAVEIPFGYEIQVRPRSGLALKGVTVWNSPGTIDAGYRGEIGVILMYTSTDASAFHIKKGDRIAQLVLAKIPDCEVFEVSELSESSRGCGGFGSTGV